MIVLIMAYMLICVVLPVIMFALQQTNHLPYFRGHNEKNCDYWQQWRQSLQSGGAQNLKSFFRRSINSVKQLA